MSNARASCIIVINDHMERRDWSGVMVYMAYEFNEEQSTFWIDSFGQE